MQLDFTLDTKQRLRLYEDEVRWFERLASEAGDDNSRTHWEKRAEEWRVMANRLKGA